MTEKRIHRVSTGEDLTVDQAVRLFQTAGDGLEVWPVNADPTMPLSCKICGCALPTETHGSVLGPGHAVTVALPCQGCLTHRGKVIVRGNPEAVQEYRDGKRSRRREEMRSGRCR